MFFIGCAGWSVPKSAISHFPSMGSHLERYAARFNAVEINSSFYRPHRSQTYARWAASVPDTFRFAVKVPKSMTHEHRLKNTRLLLQAFLEEIAELGDKLGPLLVQLPPSLRFDLALAEEFFSELRASFPGAVVCEPRHASWFAPEAERLLISFQVARVAADPPPVPPAATPGCWSGLAYFRLHGSPTIYYSAYESRFLEAMAVAVRDSVAQGAPTWCIFDNTAQGAATQNALELITRLGSENH